MNPLLTGEPQDLGSLLHRLQSGLSRSQPWLRLGTVLVPLDLTAASLRALPFARALAVQFQMHVTLLHVLPAEPDADDDPMISLLYQEMTTAVNQVLAQLTAALDLPSGRTRQVVARGRLVDEIGRLVQEEGIDLIVIAEQRPGILQALRRRSLQRALRRRVDCPMVFAS